MAKSSGRSFTVAKSGRSSGSGVFTTLKANGRTTSVMNADVYAAASAAANSVIRSASSGRSVGSRQPNTTVAQRFVSPKAK